MLKKVAYFPGIHTEDLISGDFRYIYVVVRKAKKMVEKIKKKKS